jgi:hypothetical protein
MFVIDETTCRVGGEGVAKSRRAKLKVEASSEASSEASCEASQPSFRPSFTLELSVLKLRWRSGAARRSTGLSSVWRAPEHTRSHSMPCLGHK